MEVIQKFNLISVVEGIRFCFSASHLKQEYPNLHCCTVHCCFNVFFIFLFFNLWFRASWFNVNKKVQLDATVCRHLFTATSLYMFQASQHPSSGVLKTVTANSGIGHNIGTATSFQRGLIRTGVSESCSCTNIMNYTRGSGYSFSTPDDGCCDARNM